MTAGAGVNAAVVRELLDRWVPGETWGAADVARATRLVGRVGAALGVVDDGAERPFEARGAAYQSFVIARAIDAEAGRFAGTTAAPPLDWVSVPTGGTGTPAILQPTTLRLAVDVNRATVDELVALPALGPVTARRIVAHRVEVPFRDLDQVRIATGLSPTEFARVAPFLRVKPDAPPTGRVAAVDAVAERGLAALISAVASGAIGHPEIAANDPRAALWGALQRIATEIERRRVRPRFWKPDAARLARGTGALVVSARRERSAARGGVTVAPVSSGAYLPLVQALLDGATQRAWVSMFFFRVEAEGPGRDLVGRLAAAAQRGVDVRVILSDDLPGDYHGARDVNADAFRALRDAGVAVRASHRELTDHAKQMLVDDRHVVIGSHNWTPSSFFRYGDTSVYVASSQLAAELGAVLDRRWRALADDAAAREVSLLDLELLTEAQREAARAAGWSDGAALAARVEEPGGAEAVAAALRVDVARVNMIARVATLMVRLRIAEPTAAALVARGFDTVDKIRATEREPLVAALSDLSVLPLPVSIRRINPAIVDLIRS